MVNKRGKPKRGADGRFTKKVKSYGNDVGIWQGSHGVSFNGSYDVYGSQPEPTPVELMSAYEDIVYACVNIIAHNVAGTRIRLVATTGTGQPRPQSVTKHLPHHDKKRISNDHRKYARKAVNLEEVVDHPLLDLLENPNPHQNLNKLLGMTCVYMLLVGSAYWRKLRNPLTGEVIELWVMPPQCVKITTGKNGHLSGYTYTPQNGGETEDLRADDVIHFRFFNPYDPYTSMGVSPLRSVWQKVQLLRREQTSWEAVLVNMSFPSALIYPPEEETYNTEQAERIAKTVEERFRFGNQGGVWVLQDHINYQPVTTPPKDLASLSLYQSFKEAVCHNYFVPLPLLDGSLVSGDAANTVWRFFQRNAQLPLTINILDTITQSLCSERLFLATDEVVEPDRNFELQRTSALYQANLISQNEARSTQGLEPVPGGERFLYQLIGTGQGTGGTMGTLPSFNKTTKALEIPFVAPDPTPLAEALREAFRRFGEQFTGKRTKALIPFADWTRELTDVLTPLLRVYYEDGSNEVKGLLGVDTELPVLDVNALDRAVRRAALVLADSTLRATEQDVAQATEATRQAIEQGLDQGDGDKQLTDRIGAIFTDLSERRSRLIAETESSRCKHAGQMLAIQESGLEAKKVWLSDSMACPKCMPLNGTAKNINEPFAVIDGGPYGTIDHPPRHPACRCTLTYEVE